MITDKRSLFVNMYVLCIFFGLATSKDDSVPVFSSDDYLLPKRKSDVEKSCTICLTLVRTSLYIKANNWIRNGEAIAKILQESFFLDHPLFLILNHSRQNPNSQKI